MKRYVISEFGGHLSSRTKARELRNDIEAHVPAVLDFAGVRVVSHSFIDELLAVLAVKYGAEWFGNNIKCENMTDGVRTSLLEAVSYRMRLARKGTP